MRQAGEGDASEETVEETFARLSQELSDMNPGWEELIATCRQCQEAIRWFKTVAAYLGPVEVVWDSDHTYFKSPK